MVKRKKASKAQSRDSSSGSAPEGHPENTLDVSFELGESVWLKFASEPLKGIVRAYSVRLGASEVVYEVLWENFEILEHSAFELTSKAPVVF